jgi:HK97 family phage major capsid protein
MTYHERLKGRYHALERKDESGGAITPELKKLNDELLSSVAKMREKNDEHFEELRKKKVDDVVVKDHVDRINGAITALEEKMTAEILEVKRAAIFAKNGKDDKAKAPELVAYEQKFSEYLRKGGERRAEELRPLEDAAVEAKALSTNVESSGGFTVLPQIDQNIIDLTVLVSSVRSIAAVQQISSPTLERIVNVRGTDAGHVGEVDPRVQTNTSSFEKLEFHVGEIYAQPAATQQMLDDSYINVEQWIASEVATGFARVEGIDAISGDGVKKARGFLSYPVVADANWSWGNVGYIPTGTLGAFTPVSAGPPIVQGVDVFFDLIEALNPPFLPGAGFVANRRTVAQMRKFKNLMGDYIWQPGLTAGAPATFLDYPITRLEHMPDIAANSYSIAFGDFRQFYQIVDRIGIRTLRDPFTAKPYILFYTTKRTGGGILNFEAAKFLKFSAT